MSDSASEQCPLVSVIIPVYNDAERLRRCLEALENQTYPADRYEVIVVDNGSDEPVAPAVTAFPHVRLAREATPGAYAARNTGLALARGEVLAFTDADCIPYPDWIEKGTARLLSEPGCGLVGGRIEVFPLDPDHPTAVELYELVNAFRMKDWIHRHHYAPTANVFTTRAVIDHVGPFDASLLAASDVKWGHQVHGHGYRLSYAGDACVRHPARRTFQEIRRQQAYYVAGDLGLIRQHTPPGGLADLFFVLDELMFPVRTVLRIVRSGYSLPDVFKIVFVLAWVRGVRLWEKLRLLLGGVSHER